MTKQQQQGPAVPVYRAEAARTLIFWTSSIMASEARHIERSNIIVPTSCGNKDNRQGVYQG